MRAPRPFVTALTGVALLLALSGCEKPTPAITLQSGGDVVRFDATSYCEGGKFLLKGDECHGAQTKPALLKVRAGETVTVDVDKALADTGWFLFDLDAKRRYNYNEELFTSFVADFTNRPAAGLMNFELYQVDKVPATDAGTAKITGRWRFQLIQK